MGKVAQAPAQASISGLRPKRSERANTIGTESIPLPPKPITKPIWATERCRTFTRKSGRNVPDADPPATIRLPTNAQSQTLRTRDRSDTELAVRTAVFGEPASVARLPDSRM